MINGRGAGIGDGGAGGMSECWVCEMGWPVFWTNESYGLSQPICDRHATAEPDMPNACQWCSNGGYKIYHHGPCPRIKSLEYNTDGTLKRVEFMQAIKSAGTP